ncbi:MAG: 50S ribosomal protein L23 [Alphaproteobacteria bacterium]|jgi:large subunit ribosomal protein L23|nr:50S ribosomal protein L23 [Alphaproteobacteria bacterium]
MESKIKYSFIDKLSPLVTEKSLKVSEHSYVVFKGPKSATKGDVQRALTFLYKGSKILKITSSLTKGKVKKFKGKIGKRADFKKFFVKFEKPIDITTGIK